MKHTQTRKRNFVRNAALALLIGSTSLFATTGAEAKTSTSSSYAVKHCTTMKVVNGKVWKDVYYIMSGENYHMFLDTSAEPGSNIFAVHRNSLIRWNIEIMKAKPGQTFTGVFDKTGRDLLKVKY